MKRSFLVLLAVVLVAACADTPEEGEPSSSPSATDAASEAPSARSGRIVFTRGEAGTDEAAIYTVNPDGSDIQELLPAPSMDGTWSPDGTEISVFCCDDGQAAHFVDVESGDLRTLEPPDPALETFCGGAWSPDGERVSCEVFGADDPSLNGMYTISAADGSDLTRVTKNPGGTDIAGDYSPDGERIVFFRWKNEAPVGMYVTNTDGSGLSRLAPKDMVLDDSGHAGSWSPTGKEILFVARESEDHHKAIWVVSPDGGEPEQLPIEPTCGGRFEAGEFGCYSPAWSPDGAQIVFTRSDGSGESIYIVNADGSGLVQVTDGEDDQPDWGAPPAPAA